MRLMQQGSVLEDFLRYLRSRSEDIKRGSNIVLLFTQTGTLSISIRKSKDGESEPTGSVNWLSGLPEKSIESPPLCRALLEVWLGENAVVPNAKPVFANGARALLESENIRRQTRKGGSG